MFPNPMPGMASIQPESQDQRASGLSLSLSSNNPFRNRATSPLPTTPTSPFDDPPPRPASNNPFLDPTQNPSPTLRSPPYTMDENPTNMSSPPAASPSAAALFDGLSLEDKSKNPPPRPPPMNRPGPPRGGENMPPPARRGPPPSHRPTRSQEEAMRRRRPNGPNDPSSPPRRVAGRPRGGSESSAADDKFLTEEEKKERERRRRHHEKRSKSKPTNKKMDLIDRLDATSIYGTGMFHHDGPFDAVLSHRNKSSQRAPMEAFAKDSLNMSMGGSGPLNAKGDHATFMGNATTDAFTDYATAAADYPSRPKNTEMPVFDPRSRGSIIHGDESIGLGTSTFLEGTPATRSAVQRLEQEQASLAQEGGLQRKKSLAQRIRGMNRGPRGDYRPSDRMTNHESPFRDHASSASMSATREEKNPFFNEFDKNGGDEHITVRKMSHSGPTSPPMPGHLERRATTDALGEVDETKQKSSGGGGGFLSRVKSLKGGPRSRPTERETPPGPPTAV